MAFNESSYSDLTYEEALAVLEGEVSIIDPALIFFARKKAEEALKYMIKKEENTMKQTFETKYAVGTVFGIWEMRDHIDFLKGFDTRTDVDTCPPGEGISHNQQRVLLGRACRVVESVLLNGGTQEEIERAVKFAFIVLDAEKHLLDVKQAKVKYGFRELEDKYLKVQE